MNAKTVCLTGCTSGIGLATAKGLAIAGQHLVLISRDLHKLDTLRQDLLLLNPEIMITTYACDFGQLKHVVKTAGLITATHPSIDTLINNAGIWSAKAQNTAEGFEQTWAVNYFAPYLLTHHLLPTIVQTASQTGDGRIINVSSNAHRYALIDFDNFFDFGPQKTYGATKLANVLHTISLSRRLQGTGITVNTLHPGVIATDLWRSMPRPIPWIMKKLLKSPQQGAQTTLYLALREPNGETGQYYANSRLAKTSRSAASVELQDQLESFTAQTLADFLS